MSWVKNISQHVNKRKNNEIEASCELITYVPDEEVSDYLGFVYLLAKLVSWFVFAEKVYMCKSTL